MKAHNVIGSRPDVRPVVERISIFAFGSAGELIGTDVRYLIFSAFHGVCSQRIGNRKVRES